MVVWFVIELLLDVARIEFTATQEVTLMSNAAQQRFTSVRGFSEACNLSQRTLWTLIQQGRLPVYRVGRRTLINLDEGIEAIRDIGRPKPAPGQRLEPGASLEPPA